MKPQPTDLDRALVHLCSAYRTELDALQLAAYRRGLRDLDGATVRVAADLLIKEREFFPTVAVIREFYAVAHANRKSKQLALGPAKEKIWQMGDADHAELMRQIRACGAKLKAMK